MDIFASWPSTSTLWDGEERASLTWDDAEEPLMLPTLQPPQQLQPQQLREPLNLPLIFKEARLQAHCNRRDTFAGFPVLPILLLPVQGKGRMRSSTRILICTRILNSKSSVSSMYKIKINSQYPVDILDVLFHH